MRLPESSSTKRETLLLALIATAVSIIAVTVYYHRDALLLYGDAVAHINIARRVFDSRRPGPSQLGTVWLPLPHILMLPFIISRKAWQTGLGGAIPSMIGYVAGVLGIFRLLRGGLGIIDRNSASARVAAWLGALIFAANPNLIYLQTTAMGESIYFAFFLWATVFFAEFVQSTRPGSEISHSGRTGIEGGKRSLILCGWMLLCGILSRYDGWFAAGVFGVAVVVVLWKRSSRGDRRSAFARAGFRTFVLLVVAGPLFWLVWNAIYFGSPMAWMNGPYSAQAIMQRSIQKGQPPHPGYHDLKTAAVYYVKCAKLNVSGENLQWGGAVGWRYRVENTWPVLALLGTLLLLLFARQLWPLLLLWIPLAFYPISIAYGGVPIFMPVWWPFSYYNVRYGIQLLPALAVFIAFAFYGLSALVSRRGATVLLALLAFGFVAVSYQMIWETGPVCLLEAETNSRTRVPLERRAGQELRALPASSTFLMETSYYVGILQRAGIPLKRTINETDLHFWKAALADPARYVNFAVAADGDEVSQAVKQHAADFELVASFPAPGQPTVTIYRKK